MTTFMSVWRHSFCALACPHAGPHKCKETQIKSKYNMKGKVTTSQVTVALAT